jgi:hypothetical protein
VHINQDETNHEPTQGPPREFDHPHPREYASRTTIDEHFGTNEHPADMNEEGDIRMEYPPEYRDNGSDIPHYNFPQQEIPPTMPTLPDLTTQLKELGVREARLAEDQRTFRETVQQEEQRLNTKKAELENEQRRFNAEKEVFKHELQRLVHEKEELDFRARELRIQETRLNEERMAFGYEKRRFTQERSWQGRSFRFRRRARPVRTCWDPDCSACETGSGLSDEDTDMPEEDFMRGHHTASHERASRFRGGSDVDDHEGMYASCFA